MEQKRAYSIRETKEILECSETAKYQGLGVQVEFHEKGRYQFWQGLIEKLDTYLKQGRSECITQIRREFNENYLADFFVLKSQYESAKAADERRMIRIVTHLYRMGAYKGTTSFEIPVGQRVNGVEVNSLYGKCFLFQNTRGWNAVQIMNSLPSYSQGARLEKKKVVNSLELLSMLAGIEIPKESLTATLLYAKVDREQEDQIKEDLPAGNIISLSMSREEAEECLKSLLTATHVGTCDLCRFRHICELHQLPLPVHQPKKEPERKEQRKEVLTKAQQAIVNHIDGPLCCIAVPGSGKTFSLIKRMENLLQNGVLPEKILFITFTRKAADEIRERIRKRNWSRKEAEVTTFHAFAMKLIHNSESDQRNARLAESIERKKLILDVLRELGIPKLTGTSKSLYGEYGILSTLDRAFLFLEANGMDEFLKKYSVWDTEPVLKFYERYQRLYQAEGYISYDQMVPLALSILKEDGNYLKKVQQRYQYIMADEYQDVSKEQAEILYLISSHRNLVVVGDDDQSIYSWRGGSNRFMLEFKQDWPDGEYVFMEDNFRSTDMILRAADKLIENNTCRLKKHIISHASDVESPVLYTSFYMEHMPSLIREILSAGYRPGDIAILSRKNHALDEIAKVLEGDGFQTIRPKIPLLTDPVYWLIRDCFSLYYTDMKDDEALVRILSRTGFQIDGKLQGDGSVYERMCANALIYPVDVFMTLEEYEEAGQAMPAFKTGYVLMQIFKEIIYHTDLEVLVETILDAFSVTHDPFPDVASVLLKKAEERVLPDSKRLYEYMLLMEEYEDDTDVEYQEDEEKINLLTAHKSKGKEYPVVILYKVEEYATTEEDRNVLYVAMTRAKKKLYLTESPGACADLMIEVDGFVKREEVTV